MARIAGVNIPQDKVVHIALTYIHGIGDFNSKVICEKLNISPNKRVNALTVDEVLKHALTKTLKPVKWAEIDQASAKKDEVTSRH